MEEFVVKIAIRHCAKPDSEELVEAVHSFKLKQGDDFRTQILKQLGLHANDERTITKLRDMEGVLLPFQILSSTHSKQFVIEIMSVRRNDPVIVQKNHSPSHISTLKQHLESLEKRLARIETLAPQMRLNCQERMEKEVEQLSTTLNFLHKRFAEADSAPWKPKCNIGFATTIA